VQSPMGWVGWMMSQVMATQVAGRWAAGGDLYRHDKARWCSPGGEPAGLTVVVCFLVMLQFTRQNIFDWT